MISQTFPGRNVATSLTRHLSFLLIKCTYWNMTKIYGKFMAKVIKVDV